MFGIVKLLIRLARKVVEQVLGQFTQQLNIVEEQALAPMRAMVQSVTNGIWVGEGANAFVNEVSSMMIPGVGRVADSITTMGNNIRHAQDVMDQADDKVNQLITSRIFDAFKFF